MRTMDVRLRDGDVYFHCDACDTHFRVDPDVAFMPQLHAIVERHQCDPAASPDQTPE